jgi:hypothetical protein
MIEGSRVTCRSCGAEIAANAIVCYRCGAPTAEPVSRPGRPAGRRWWPTAALAVAAAAAVWVAVAAPGGGVARWMAAGVAALCAGAALAVARRR